jgi:hypothetical protein
MVARQKPKRKKSVPPPRKARTGLAAAPTQSFHAFRDYFRLDLERKEVAVVLKTYIRDNYTGEERKLLLSGPEHVYTSHYGPAAGIQWKNLGYDWPETYRGEKAAKSYVEMVRHWAEKKIAEQVQEASSARKPVRSPMEIVKERTSDFIGEVEAVLDDFFNGVYQDSDNYSVYAEMVKSDLNSFSANSVLKYYQPQLAELQELVIKKTPELVEGYSHLSIPRRKAHLKLVQAIVDDAERYVLSKKAVRKPSKPRVKSADKQVSKLNFARDSKEYKITSINPTLIVGANRLYTFNVKYRTITEYVTESPKGFEVRGSTVYGIDLSRSRATRLRKPGEQLSTFLTKTPTAINKFWNGLTTKTTSDVKGRINKDTILLRALDK